MNKYWIWFSRINKIGAKLQNQLLEKYKSPEVIWNIEKEKLEKFEAQGPTQLTTSELLAILIGSGNTDENAVSLMQRILNDCGGSLTTLGRKTIAELCQYKGVGPAKAITILAACEIGVRRGGETCQRTQVTSAEDIYDYFRPKMQDLAHEESHLLLLNQRLSIINSRLISRGGITGTVVDIRMILKEALMANATNIALAHNHPSGNLKPSREDDHLTERLKKAAQTMDIKLIDHVIVTDKGYYSYNDEGRI